MILDPITVLIMHVQELLTRVSKIVKQRLVAYHACSVELMRSIVRLGLDTESLDVLLFNNDAG